MSPATTRSRRAAALTPDGKYVLIGDEGFGAIGKRAFGLRPRLFGLIARSLFVKPLRLGRASLPGRAEAMGLLAGFLDAGTVTLIVDSTYPLSRTRDALRHLIADAPSGRSWSSPDAGRRTRWLL